MSILPKEWNKEVITGLSVEEKIKEEREKRRKENEEKDKRFLDDLIERAGHNKVITLALQSNKEKQLAMNYLLFEKNFICVQNDVSSKQYSTVFTLTFVKREFLSSFAIGKI